MNGVIVVAKPTGPTSHDVVGLVRRMSGTKRVGHGGTLDPFAAGVLPVFLGHATRLVEYHLADEKEYRALVAFGARSTTDDIEGELSPSGAAAPTRDGVELALAAFRGQIEQVPPDYSAVKVAGRKAYELARHGRKPELRPRVVTVSRLEIADWDDSEADRPTATLVLRCSAGTYVRALARDLGEALGCGAYLAALTRTASGPFRLEQAHGLDAVRAALADGRLAEIMLPPDTGLEHLPHLTVDADSLRSLTKGQPIKLAGNYGDGPVLLVDNAGALAAVARRQDAWLRPEKVFVGPD